MKLQEYFLCAKKTIITIYSTIFVPELPYSAILKSTLHWGVISIVYVQHARALSLNINNADCTDYVLGYSPKWRKTVTRGQELSNKLLFAMFLDLGTLQLRCCLWRVRELSEFIKNILNCVPKFGMTWGWVINDSIFIFGWTNTLSLGVELCAFF